MVGVSRAKDLLLTARDVAADEALAIGLVDEVVGAGEAVARALGWVEEVATRAPLSTYLSKLVVNSGDDLDMDTALQIEMLAAVMAAGTDDRREGIQAFLDKRPADFRGQ